MKFSARKAIAKYDINDNNSLKLLQKRAKFKYVDKYTGKESKQFKKTFKQPKFRDLLQKYSFPPIIVAQIGVLGRRGLGVLATKDIRLDKPGKPRGLGVYWGEMSKEFTHLSHYVFIVSKYEIDAQKVGNWTRFVNHSKGNYNIVAIEKAKYIGKKRFFYMEYAAVKNIKAGEQLLVDYGPEYEFDQKHQIFLNPSNGLLHAEDIFAANQKEYELLSGKLLHIYRKLHPEAKKIYAPTQFIKILNQSHHSHVKGKIKSSVSPEIPFLSANKQGRIFEDNTQQGITTLMLAAYIGHVSAVKMLVDNYAANVDQQNIRNGNNALFYVLQSQVKPIIQKRIVNFLLNSGIDLMTQDKDGFNILHFAVKQQNLPLLKLILSNKKTKYAAMEALDALDRENLCPITYAISKADVKTTKVLLEIFEKYYKESFFHARHNKWLLPVIKKIIKNYPDKSLLSMLNMLMEKGLGKNRKALAIVIAELKRKNIEIGATLREKKRLLK